MYHFSLFRKHAWSDSEGTFGELAICKAQPNIKEDPYPPILDLYTVEQPWKNNQPFKSCIPVGEYHLEEYNSPNHGQTLMIVGGVVGPGIGDDFILRTDCLFHVANWADQVQGCIGIGTGRSEAHERGPMVTNSRAAMEQLKRTVPFDQIHRLSIRWA